MKTKGLLSNFNLTVPVFLHVHACLCTSHQNIPIKTITELVICCINIDDTVCSRMYTYKPSTLLIVI